MRRIENTPTTIPQDHASEGNASQGQSPSIRRRASRSPDGELGALKPRTVGLPSSPAAKRLPGGKFLAPVPAPVLTPIPASTHIALSSAMNGAAKMSPLLASNGPDPRCQIERWLLDNDVDKLAAASEGSGALRSFTTALKACIQIGSRPGVPDSLAAAAGDVKTFYERARTTIVPLGNMNSFSADKTRTKDEVDELVTDLREGASLMDKVRSELAKTRPAEAPAPNPAVEREAMASEDEDEKAYWGTHSAFQ